MADPVSFLAAGIGIADVALRVISYLKDVNAAADTIDDDIEGLINEVEALMAVYEHLEQDYRKNINNDSLDAEEKILWVKTGRTLENGQKLTQKLDISVREIYGKNRNVTGKRDGLLKQHRKRAKNGIICELRGQINTYHGALTFWLNYISMCIFCLHFWLLLLSKLQTDAHTGIQLAEVMRTKSHSSIS